MRVLITGGAGFIGTHLARRLLSAHCTVSVLDNFSTQVHAGARGLPPDLAPHVRLFCGDVRDRALVATALEGQDAVVHFAAETGTGQSMYAVSRYASVNVEGTACVLDVLVNQDTRSVRKMLVASSRAVYGEGKYHCPVHGDVYPGARLDADLRSGRFEPRCPRCDGDLASVATDEASPLDPGSFYGLTKQMQEQMVLMFGRSLGLDAFALRYQNVYGPGQSLINPYTGILSIFSGLARQGRAIEIFEDGLESRDFVHVDDVVECTWRALQPDMHGVAAINVGSGERTSVREVAEAINAFYGGRSEVFVSGAYRVGDIRHNVADLTRARQLVGYLPLRGFADGLDDFLAWTLRQDAHGSAYTDSLEEMRDKGLLRSGGDPSPSTDRSR